VVFRRAPESEFRGIIARNARRSEAQRLLAFYPRGVGSGGSKGSSHNQDTHKLRLKLGGSTIVIRALYRVLDRKAPTAPGYPVEPITRFDPTGTPGSPTAAASGSEDASSGRLKS
jgi:hypothetical protein